MWRILLARSQFVFAAAAPTADWKDLLHKGLDDWIVLGDGHWRWRSDSVVVASFGHDRQQELHGTGTIRADALHIHAA